MTKALVVLFGLLLVGLGVWGVAAWGAAILLVLKAAVVLAALLAGLMIVVFVLSDLRAPEPPNHAADAPTDSAKTA